MTTAVSGSDVFLRRASHSGDTWRRTPAKMVSWFHDLSQLETYVQIWLLLFNLHT